MRKPNSNPYSKIFRAIKNYSDPEQVVNKIGVANALSIGRAAQVEGAGDKEIEHEKEMIHEAVGKLLEKIGRNKRVLHAIEATWPDGPRVFRVYECYFDELIETAYQKLSGKQRKNVNTLLNYIWEAREQRTLTIAAGDLQCCMNIGRVVAKPELEDAKENLRNLLPYMALVGGSLIYRREEGGEDVINGFLAMEGHLVSLDAGTLKRAMEQQPDGTILTADNELYQKAFCQFV